MKREKINKQVTFEEAKAIMRKAFEDDPELKEQHIEKVADKLDSERVWAHQNKIISTNNAINAIDTLLKEF